MPLTRPKIVDMIVSSRTSRATKREAVDRLSKLKGPTAPKPCASCERKAKRKYTVEK